MNTTHAIVSRIRQQYITLRMAEIFLMATGAGAFTASVLMLLNVAVPVTTIVSFVIGVLSATIRFFYLKLHQVTEYTIIRFLHTRYPELQASGDLLIRTGQEVNAVELLQRERMKAVLLRIADSVNLPNRLGFGAAFLVVSGLTFSAIYAFHDPAPLATESFTMNMPHALPPARVPRVLESYSITVTPPAYTGISPFNTRNFNLAAPEGSRITWSLRFTEADVRPLLVFASRDTVRLRAHDNAYKGHLTITANSFYQLVWTDSSTVSSDFYKLEMIPDREPVIRVEDLPQFTEVDYPAQSSIALRTTLSDDYGLADAWLIATVAKGSGESVKFREEKLSFTAPATIQGRNVTTQRTLDFTRLGMEPGDELYFYVEALDTKTPVPNRTRTETYFISLRDTAEVYATDDAGLGVDLMPEYFRSQRQLIIDTEKLLSKRKQLARHDFNFTSNELGYDQKVLRLRYGQFMGEEFESEIAPAEADHEEGDIKAEDVTKQFGHVHDTNNEHNLVAEKKDDHEHEKKPGEKENPLEAFAHTHDNAETATFYIQSTRAKLKAALTQMWDAELYLRLYEPEKSLPYQYKALALLKEISNDSRIYVHRTGFDPPPIKEDKRLTGDLKEVATGSDKSTVTLQEKYPDSKVALQRIDMLLASGARALQSADAQILQRAGQELAQAALEQPGRYLESLSAIRGLVDGRMDTTAFRPSLLLIRRALWSLIPREATRTTSQQSSAHTLTQTFIQQLDTQH